MGAWALSYLTKIGEKVIAFVDSSVDRQGTTFMGLPVIALEQLKRKEVNQIIITSRHYIDEIRRTIQNYLGKDLEDGGGNVLTIDEFVILQCGQEKINKCAEYFIHDSYSYGLFWKIMQSRIAGSLDYLRVPGEISPKDYFSKWGFLISKLKIMLMLVHTLGTRWNVLSGLLMAFLAKFMRLSHTH